MNTEIELSPKQLEALTAILGKKNGVSPIRLSRELQCEMSPARNLIGQLLDLGYLTEFSNGLYGVSREGRDYLIKLKVPGAERKPTGAAAHANDYVDPYDMPPTDKFEEVEINPDTIPKFGNKTHRIAEWKPAESAAPEQIDFMALVYRGLSKLNAQLGVQPATIENKAIKIQALNRFADTLSGFDQALSELLRSVALDLERLGGEK